MTLAFPPITDANWPAEISDMRTGFAGQLNVYRVMAHHPALLRAWSGLREHIVNNTALGRERAEVVILRLAHRLSSGYEWNQHVARGLKVGLSKDRIASLRGPLADMAAEDAVLAGAVDTLLDQHRLAPQQMAELNDLIGQHAVLDLMATTGMYLTLGFLLETTGCPLDASVRDDLARNAPELMV
ncbi:carboxymuconolactone decarboxylase family protein [Roseinatronobacter bogoriensis]|uniref:Carboxymuconolactone decarboxylase family protein n=1 Tax=Roseinatronobacter bogoriensis subsp. barguzinensis TaxID=441209 RepID=A0A2K8KBB5_9RHOB|nr:MULTISPECIES: carboxymuconolactone decarboxylase family protein [Rhodobaca]ATX66731.1 carboxymuconolactone decarboxylase family protein [Rhodobaca barguzinensis]TDW40933.1 carboxymuconolactone decarboxylase family protein [Rhodobaca barguzinensis]TDY74889.1 carboxymuconolactone decarboxylase family protein [Rhodobaca bogoriensis DSM 18756]